MLGLLTRAMAAVSALLFVAFIVGIASAWSTRAADRVRVLRGGGYDSGASGDYPWEIARDVGLLLLSAYLVWRPAPAGLDALLFRVPQPAPVTQEGARGGHLRRNGLVAVAVIAVIAIVVGIGYAVQAGDTTGEDAAAPGESSSSTGTPTGRSRLR